MFSKLASPAIIAHRGASAYAPENTLASFELALRQEADAIELDAKLTADGHIVVIHDQTVDRTTEGTGAVREMTLSELRKLDAGSHFDIAFQGEPIPTLEEVLKAVGQLTYVNIELTNYQSKHDDLPEKTAELVYRLHLNRRVFFSSFSPIALWKIRRLMPEAPAGLLAMQGKRGSWARGWLGRLLRYQSLHPDFHDTSPALVAAAHRRGHRAFVYTVNDKEEMRRLFSLHVDGIFTDDPLLARQEREAFIQRMHIG